MRQITLCLAFHNHQPVGNFPWVFDEAYRRSYLPMVECLERHPTIRVSLHYTGPLYDWLLANQPDFVLRVAGLVNRGQVEMMTGGYYEPILPAIPQCDRIGQIRKMTEFVSRELGAKATGMWLAERVWEPQLAGTLNQAGVEWTIVDDTHFKMAGLTDDDLTGYFLTEDEGRVVKLFATSKRLRYVIPWAPVEQVLDELSRAAGEDPSLVLVMGDDGEKFGVWPGTYDHCWTNGWINRFFDALAENDSWINVMPVGEYASGQRARGRIYLPTASYAEMLEWALPPAAAVEYSRITHELEAAQRTDVTRFLRGGYWRNFLVKYDEVNTMHKKMLRTHRKVHQSGALAVPDPVALDQLWQAQCNCPYWHGVFGGIYMTDVRTATFQHLIRSEVAADRANHGERLWIAHESTDFDFDTVDELIVESSSANYYLAPDRGGSLFEWDARSSAHNLVSVMTRRPEAYHAALRRAAENEGADDSGGTKTIHDIVRLKEAGLEKLLHYDWYRRACLIDHFLQAGTSPRMFANATYGEAGDFVDQPYHVSVDGDDLHRTVRLARDGHIWVGGTRAALFVEKTVEMTADEAGFTASYVVANRHREAIATIFGIEMNLNLLGGGGNPAAFRRLGDDESDVRFDVDGTAKHVLRVSAGNRYLGLTTTFEVDRPASAWWSSIDSVSSSEGGFERVHQGASLLLSWPLRLDPGETWTVDLTARISS